MNLKASFFNYEFLKENIKKSKGIILLFIFVIPVFTYLFMLLNNNMADKNIIFPTLSSLSLPALIGMYVIPFILAASLFSFLFKKDSVDFINALPIKRETIFITNIIGGILIFFVIFLITAIMMFISNFFFDNLVIPKMMYLHYFITFFISYIFVFIVSCLTISLTGSRMVHIALTLIILFVPGFLSDFYNSRLYNTNDNDSYYPVECDRYDESCRNYDIYTKYVIENSYRIDSDSTLPYKYIGVVPRTIFGINSSRINYADDLSNVYDLASIIRMIMLSILYFMIGLYVYTKRRMEIAETTFKSEHAHQVVKCLTLFPLCIAAIAISIEAKQTIVVWILMAVIATIYVVYDLITRRNSKNFMESTLYFLGLILASFIIYISFNAIGDYEGKKMINKDDISNIGISPSYQFGSNAYGRETNAQLDNINYKIKDEAIIKLIFDNANQVISNDGRNAKSFAIRLQLKSGSTYYFNMRLKEDTYEELLDLLSKDEEYSKVFKRLPYDKAYGVKLGNTYLDKNNSDKVLSLIKEGYKSRSVKDIAIANYNNLGYESAWKYNLQATIYVYQSGIKTYSINTMINPDLANYVMQTKNNNFIRDIDKQNVNINRLSFSIEFDYEHDPNASYYYSYIYENSDEVYRYINDNIKGDIDFSKYNEDDIVCIDVHTDFGMSGNTYQVFLLKDEAYQQLLDKALEYYQNSGLRDW